MMLKACIAMLAAAAGAGCSGEYLVTLPDTVTASGNDAAAVARLRRQEVAFIRPAIKRAVVVMWIDPDAKRAAYTDAQGYVATSLPAPEQPGRYVLTFRHQDERGDEVTQTSGCYVVDGGKLVLAVDWEAIDDDGNAQAAAGPLRSLAEAGVQIVYAGQSIAANPERAHEYLAAWGLPDGPVLSWGIRRDIWGRSRGLIGSLPAARESTPGLMIVAAGDDDLLDEADEMNMIGIGVGVIGETGTIAVADWPALAKRVLAAHALVTDQGIDAVDLDAVRSVVRTAAP